MRFLQREFDNDFALLDVTQCMLVVITNASGQPIGSIFNSEA